jgi:hypothetical protein
MDWLTFISSIIKAIAWPGTLLALLLVVRKELPAIVRSLRKVKIKDVELEFGEAAKEVASEAKQSLPASNPDSKLVSGPKADIAARLEATAELSPRAAILEAWLQVEAAAADAVRKRALGPVGPMPGPMRLRDGLIRAEILSASQVKVFERLRFLRNEAVHVPEAEFTKDAVSSYIDSALAMAAYLETVAGE